MRSTATRAFPLEDVTILIASTDAIERQRIAVAIARAGGRARQAGTIEGSIEILALESIDALVCSGDLVQPDGRDWLASVRMQSDPVKRGVIALALSSGARCPSFDEQLDPTTSARTVAQRIEMLLGRAPTQRLPQVG